MGCGSRRISKLIGTREVWVCKGRNWLYKRRSKIYPNVSIIYTKPNFSSSNRILYQCKCKWFWFYSENVQKNIFLNLVLVFVLKWENYFFLHRIAIRLFGEFSCGNTHYWRHLCQLINTRTTQQEFIKILTIWRDESRGVIISFVRSSFCAIDHWGCLRFMMSRSNYEDG